MVQNGFQSMDERFQGMEERMDKGFKEINERIGVAEKMTDALQRGQERIEDRLDEIASDRKKQGEILKGHDRRISSLERRAAVVG